MRTREAILPGRALARPGPSPGSRVRAPDDLVDEAFLARLTARDERAFNQLVRLYERRVFALVSRLVGRREDAEDVAQEVFVQVFKAIGTFRGEAKLSTWIYRIAVNLAKNRNKYLARRRAESRADAVDDAAQGDPLELAKGTTVSGVPRPDEVASGKQVEVVVRAAIAGLDPDFREALVLRDLEDLGYDEIALITGVPEGTVKSRIFRARAQLKAAVEAALGEKIG